MAKTRRFEFTQGSSNKFYEVTVSQDGSKWNVKTKWGRIGQLGSEQNRKFASKGPADRFALKKISEKTRKGYVEITDDGPQERKSPHQEESKDVKLPKVWSKFQEELLPGERAVYEKHDDTRTKQRRQAIATRWKNLVESDAPNEEIKAVRKAAWLFLRYTYLNYLVSVSVYKPATHETARATVTLLHKKLKKLPENQRRVIDESLQKFTSKSGPLSLAECENGVNAFVEQLVHEIREKEKVGLGGVSRKRAQMLARRLKKDG